MRAGQFAAGILDFAQHAADHRAQGFLHDLVVGIRLSGVSSLMGAQVASALRAGQGFWAAVKRLMPRPPAYRRAMRTGRIERNTKETEILVEVNLDGTGAYEVSTGIGFLDHMIEQFSRHSLIDVTLKVKGDLHIDQHHTTEDSALALGEAIAEALGDKGGIGRYGTRLFADGRDAGARRARHLRAGRSSCGSLKFTQEKLGELDTELVEHWFHSIAQTRGITLHVELLYGQNNHHICEAAFKGFARAMRQAVEIDPRKGGAIPSTKGQLG